MAEAELVLEMVGISKSFPGVKALDRVNFSCRKGEVHALVGENGAGKSTLMKILAGALQPDSGVIYLHGEQVTFHDPLAAQRHGIRIIYQEFNLLPYLSVAENIALGQEPQNRFGWLDLSTRDQLARDALQLLDTSIDLNTLVYRLSVAQQQIVEIAKALSQKAGLIIMDEPTAALSDTEVKRLFEVISALKSAGITIIYVSHRMEEIFSIADRVTVLKTASKLTR
jgi:ribose transport system ATP-binding protein